MISYSAPAKVILSGEHSVVYGKPALVTAVDLSLTFTIKEEKKENQNRFVDKAVDYCDEIVRKYLDKNKLPYKKKKWKYSVESEIPPGRGMGSSAAFCVATVAALLHFYTGKESDKTTINNLAFRCEKYFHGMPSGVDVSASCFGGLIYYRKEFEFLKNISALNFKIPKKIEDKLVLIDSGKPKESTAEMIKHVGKKYNQYPKKMEAVLNNIEKITKRMVIAIVKEDENLFMESIAENQKQLENLGIVSESTKKLLKELRPYGVGKVTGAGGLEEGSGMILFYVSKYMGKVIKYSNFKQNLIGVVES